LGPECYNWGFAAPPVFEWSTFTHQPIWRAPHCKAGLIWLRRAHMYCFWAFTSQSKAGIKKFQLSCLRVEEKTTGAETAPPKQQH
jgi:hypothetical protein